MKKLITAALLAINFAAMGQESQVRQSIDTFFEGLHQKDTVKMQSVLAKSVVLHSVAEGKDGAKRSEENIGQFFRSISQVPKEITLHEKLLSFTIQIDGSLAHAWTPYEFYVNGKLSHSGVNSFQLVKEASGWKIVYCIDTRRKP